MVDKISLLDSAILSYPVYGKLKYARENRKNLMSGAETGVWSGRKKRKQYCRVSKETGIALHQWIRDHLQIVQSPIARDTLLVNCPDVKNQSD